MTIDTTKLIKSPEVTYDYDHNLESLLVTVELPGVEPDAFELHIALCGFHISAKTSEIQYVGNYRFFHEVDAEAAKIEFRNGTLSMRIPFFIPLGGKQSPMETDID